MEQELESRTTGQLVEVMQVVVPSVSQVAQHLDLVSQALCEHL